MVAKQCLPHLLNNTVGMSVRRDYLISCRYPCCGHLITEVVDFLLGVILLVVCILVRYVPISLDVQCISLQWEFQ